MTSISILALTHGDPESRHSFSGTNYGVLSGLKEKQALFNAYDVELYGIRRYVPMLFCFRPDKLQWKHNFRTSPVAFAMRSATATKHVRDHLDDISGVLQFGALFAPSFDLDIPVYSYHDNTVALSQRGGKYSFNWSASRSYVEKALERERRIYRRNRKIFVFSDFVKQSMVNDFGVEPGKIHVVYSGVSIDTTRTEVSDEAAKYGSKTILFVGVDFERKGGLVLLDAFRAVRKEVPDAKLIIVGSSPDVQEEGVVVRGFINQGTEEGRQEMNRLFREASVFTMPSLFEPFGIPYCEAMHYQTPCVGVRLAAIPEIVVDGETGLLAEPGDAVDLAEKLITLLKDEDLMRRMGQAGRARALGNYTWEAVTDKMVREMGS